MKKKSHNDDTFLLSAKAIKKKNVSLLTSLPKDSMKLLHKTYQIFNFRRKKSWRKILKIFHFIFKWLLFVKSEIIFSCLGTSCRSWEFLHEQLYKFVSFTILNKKYHPSMQLKKKERSIRVARLKVANSCIRNLITCTFSQKIAKIISHKFQSAKQVLIANNNNAQPFSRFLQHRKCNARLWCKKATISIPKN